MADLNKIVQDLSGLTLLEAAELIKRLEEEWGVSAAAPVAVAASAAPAADAAEEKTDWDVVLVSAGDNKIGVIKVVRELTSLGLAEAKALAETANANVKTGLNKADAEAAQKKLAEAGATVKLV